LRFTPCVSLLLPSGEKRFTQNRLSLIPPAGHPFSINSGFRLSVLLLRHNSIVFHHHSAPAWRFEVRQQHLFSLCSSTGSEIFPAISVDSISSGLILIAGEIKDYYMQIKISRLIYSIML